MESKPSTIVQHETGKTTPNAISIPISCPHPATLSPSTCSDDSMSSVSFTISTPRSSTEMPDASPIFTFAPTSASSISSYVQKAEVDMLRNSTIADQSKSPCVPRSIACQTDDWSLAPSYDLNPTNVQSSWTKQLMKGKSTLKDPRKLLFGRRKSSDTGNWEDQTNGLKNSQRKKSVADDAVVFEQEQVLEEVPTTERRLSKQPILPPQGIFEVDSKSKYGSGAWSNVYKGTLHTKDKYGKTKDIVIAVKQPLNTFSKPTIIHEAGILSHMYQKLSAFGSEQAQISLISFHGFDQATSSILMTACPGENVNRFIERHDIYLKQHPSNTTLRMPVIGVRQWIFLAERLVGAFKFLKDSGIIHGDIKPHNIMLREWKSTNQTGAWWSNSPPSSSEVAPPSSQPHLLMEPIVSDFSSSYIVNNDGAISDEEEPISAVTTTYCAPELLAAFLTPPVTPTKQPPPLSSSTSQTPSASPASINLRMTQSSLSPNSAIAAPRPLPTFSSDLYSLSITLLQAAIGSHPYSAARMDIQKNMWVRQGDPLSFARADERAFRCQKGGIVARLIQGCFGKTSDGRTTIEEMLQRVQGMGEEWRSKEQDGAMAWVWGK